MADSQPLAPGGDGLVAWLLACAASALAAAAWTRHRLHAPLQQARAELQLERQLAAVWRWRTDAEGRLLRFDPPAAADAAEWREASWIGRPLWDCLDDAAQSLAPRMRAGAPLRGLRLLQQPDSAAGAPRPWQIDGQPWLDAQGRFAGYLGTAQPLEQAESLAAAQATVQALLADGPCALGRLSRGPEGWQLVAASPGLAKALGLAMPTALPCPWTAWIAPLAPIARAALASPGAAAAGEPPDPLASDPAPPLPPMRWLPDPPPGPAGDTGAEPLAWLLALGAPMAATDPAEAAWARDLAAEHEAFSYTISHDLRAPIRVVEGFGRILKEDHGPQLDRIGNDHLDRIVAAAARMNQMIDALLSLSQLSTRPLARQPVNLSQLAGFIIEDLQRIEPERRVRVLIQPDLSVQGDPTLLRMALENLLGNAWKYSSRTAQAEIRFERTEHTGRACYCVRDNGAGFDMRFGDRLFGVFQRLHSASDFQGTGVGLASVRRIVRRHGGEVWAESEVGHGARFYFTLKA